MDGGCVGMFGMCERDVGWMREERDVCWKSGG